MTIGFFFFVLAVLIVAFEAIDTIVKPLARARKAEAERDEFKSALDAVRAAVSRVVAVYEAEANDLLARAEKAEADLDALQSWQPIETAPRDGTRLWCYWPHAWSDERQAVGWFVSYGEAEYWTNAADSDPHPPTHWRRLPAEPVTAAEQENPS